MQMADASSWSPTLLVNTESFQTIDPGDGTTNIELRFGTNLNATMMYDRSNSRFDFSKSVYIHGDLTATGSLTILKNAVIKGNLSGASLTVGGPLTLNGVAYTMPTSHGSNGTYLKENGSGALTWTAISTTGSGSASLQPIYPNAVYFSSGAALVGQLTNLYDSTNKENYYHWTSTSSAFNTYWIAVRVRLPANFSSWDTVKPIEFRYRTATSSSSDNAMRLDMLDTSGNPVTLTGNGGLAAVSWTTATITGPEAGGTFAKNGVVTIYVKIGTTSAGSSDAGFINLNWHTSN